MNRLAPVDYANDAKLPSWRYLGHRDLIRPAELRLAHPQVNITSKHIEIRTAARLTDRGAVAPTNWWLPSHIQYSAAESLTRIYHCGRS